MFKGHELPISGSRVGVNLFEEMVHRSQYGTTAITEKDLRRYIGGKFIYRETCLTPGKRRHGVCNLTGQIIGIEANFPVVTISHGRLLKKAPRKSAWKEIPQMSEDEFVFVMNGWKDDQNGYITLLGDDPRIEILLVPPELVKDLGI